MKNICFGLDWKLKLKSSKRQFFNKFQASKSKSNILNHNLQTSITVKNEMKQKMIKVIILFKTSLSQTEYTLQIFLQTNFPKLRHSNLKIGILFKFNKIQTKSLWKVLKF